MIRYIWLIIGLCLSVAVCNLTLVRAANPITDTGVCPVDFYQDNDITTYNKCAVASCTESTATLIDIATGDLPAETVKYIENQDVKGRVEKNMERYIYGQKHTGIPWQISAALHYREAGLNPSKSMADGSALTAGRSNDNLPINPDPNKDTVLQLNHFMKMARDVYGVDLKQSNVSIDRWGLAFLAYNRGYMYKNWNKGWQESPYVVNGFDAKHVNMIWTDADSYERPGGEKKNSVTGKPDGNKAGALSIFKYLGGLSAAGPANTTTQAQQTSPEDFICPSSGGGAATIVGDMAFPLMGTKKTATTSPGMFSNNTTSRGGHPYIAYDIMAKPGTPVAAFLGGTVTRIGQDKCPGRLVSVYSQESNLTVSYLHMNLNTEVQQGQVVTVGQRIGQVGPPGAGCGSPHLHIDAATGTKRPGCRRENCPVANQKFFVDIGPQLYTTFQAVPN